MKKRVHLTITDLETGRPKVVNGFPFDYDCGAFIVACQVGDDPRGNTFLAGAFLPEKAKGDPRGDIVDACFQQIGQALLELPPETASLWIYRLILCFMELLRTRMSDHDAAEILRNMVAELEAAGA